ncbi:dipeptide ABC transporter ATP-binding protein DppD [Kushneria phosphatilytica]|uniref:ABC-type dipeptide transporter n=2 Tax=Kushneria phosphatilytica TaxID=657387 RepID=A0A1S1NY26_9GAMM|nr:dipeptide ABC transporter ATP-binding protein DppD [Kushneria phosphatilytica]QEL12814.1 ABC transporter ATP-binding protein [Kushneria phosphatilytica]
MTTTQTKGNGPLLDIRRLSVSFQTRSGLFPAVSDIDMTLNEGEVLGVVGESGSGKSVTMLAMMGLLPFNANIEADRFAFADNNMLTLSDRARRKLTGNDIAMIFQEPATSLNPSFTIGYQIDETLKVHEGGSRRQRRERAIELLDRVGIPAPTKRLGDYPHQLSGGMNQRVMIAIAIACNPRLLIADEPTTALDVTIQAQILDLLLQLQQERGMAMILITHDMGVVAEAAERISVMYAGQLVETGYAGEVFHYPRHPYTAALLDALPERHPGQTRLPTIPGVVPGIADRPSGCLFNPRCRFAQEDCRQQRPELSRVGEDDDHRESTGHSGEHQARCFHPLDTNGPTEPVMGARS